MVHSFKKQTMKYKEVFCSLVLFAGFASECFAATSDATSDATSGIIQPIRSTGDEVGLIFVPGAGLDEQAYRKTAEAIQKASNLRLWIALTGSYFQITALQLPQNQVKSHIEESVKALQKAGMKGNNFAGIGHSLGGVFLSMIANQTQVKSIILLGSYISRDTKLSDYPLPILTLSGELDGQARITRIAVEYEKLQKDIVDSPEAVYKTPVINIKGSNHAQFASGTMPERVRKYDLQSDITEDEAHKQIGKHCSNFLTATFGTRKAEVANAKKGIKAAYDDSALRFQPLLDVKALEVNDDRSMSSWAISAQSYIAGQYRSQIKITNEVKTDGGSFRSSRAKLTKNDAGITVDTTAWIGYQSNSGDRSTIPEGVREIVIKMKSRDAIAEAIKGCQGCTDEKATCKDINQQAFNLALKSSTEEAQTRYNKRGRPIIFEEDSVMAAGPLWLPIPISLSENNSGLHVRSIALKTSTQVRRFPAGMHYCKVLSPYRAMEWINVDSLRREAP